MAGQLCSTCRAPLKLIAGATVVDCPYCGASNRVEGAPPDLASRLGIPKEQVEALAARQRRAFRLGLAVVLLFIGAIVLVGVLVTRSGRSTAPSAPAASSSPATTSPAERGIPLAQLSTLDAEGPFRIDAPGMVGTLQSFDAIANLEWATSIAKAWSGDAQLDLMRASGVRADGGPIDLVNDDEADVEYDFHSPARVASAESLRQVSDAKALTAIEIRVMNGAVTGRLGTWDELPLRIFDRGAGPPAELKNTCTTARLLEIAFAGGLARRPHYDLRLEPFAGRWRWTYYADDLDDYPAPVMAETCRLAAELPEPGKEDRQDLERHEPFDWGTFIDLPGCECPAPEGAAAPVRLAAIVTDSSYSLMGGKLSGSFDLAWVLRSGDALPFRLAVDEGTTAPPGAVEEADSAVAVACDGGRMAAFFGRRSSAWSFAGRTRDWAGALDADLQLPSPPAEGARLPIESTDVPVVVRCAVLPVTDGFAEVPVAGGVRRVSMSDGTASDVPQAENR